MIKLQKTGACEDCPFMDLEVIKGITAYSGGGDGTIGG